MDLSKLSDEQLVEFAQEKMNFSDNVPVRKAAVNNSTFFYKYCSLFCELQTEKIKTYEKHLSDISIAFNFLSKLQ